MYQRVTDKIIAELEAGRASWAQSWGADHVSVAIGLPVNAHTDRTYSGINILLLWGAAIEDE